MLGTKIHLVFLLTILSAGLCLGQEGSTGMPLICDIPGSCQLGELIGFSVEPSQYVCHQVCSTTAECQFYTFNSADGFCGLYPFCPDVAEEACPTCITSWEPCPLPPFCKVPGACQGTYLADFLHETAEHCEKECTFYPDCNFYTHDSSESLCILFSTCTIEDANQCRQCVSGEPNCLLDLQNSVRLEGGSGPHEGNVFVKLTPDSEYGQVCDDLWDVVNAGVVCRQLGFEGAVRATIESEFGAGSNDFAMDNVQCTGSEDILQDCPFSATEDCAGSELAGVECLQN